MEKFKLFRFVCWFGCKISLSEIDFSFLVLCSLPKVRLKQIIQRPNDVSSDFSKIILREKKKTKSLIV